MSIRQSGLKIIDLEKPSPFNSSIEGKDDQACVRLSGGGNVKPTGCSTTKLVICSGKNRSKTNTTEIEKRMYIMLFLQTSN